MSLDIFYVYRMVLKVKSRLNIFPILQKRLAPFVLEPLKEKPTLKISLNSVQKNGFTV